MLRRVLSLLVLGTLGIVCPARATLLSPFIDLQEPGLSIVEDGAGLRADGTATLQVNIGGTVRAALLYWAGRDTACPEVAGDCVIPSQPYLDQQLIFDGTPITGTLIGEEQQPTLNINNIGYFADVTSLVSAGGPGLRTFSIADGNGASNFDVREGISLIVLYTDASDPATYRVQLSDGLDFAWGSDPDAGDSRTTAAVSFNHGSVVGARAATVYIVAGDGDSGFTDQLDISGNPSVANPIDGTEGAVWDSESFPITIAGGVASTVVQLQSNGATPDDFLWEVAALRVLIAPGSPTIQFASSTYSTIEESGVTGITVTRTSSAGAASFTFTTSDGTATSPADYAGFTTTVNFADGVSSVNTPILLVNDPADEGCETFNVAISNPSAGYLIGTPSTAVVTICDSADTPAIPALSPFALVLLAAALAIAGVMLMRMR